MPDSATPPEVSTLFATVETQMQAVDAWLAARFLGAHPRLSPLLAHASRFRGKRLRAALVCLLGKACAGLTPEHVTVAGVLEMIHAATLVHDDLLDEASHRRGVDCLHVEWGSHASVLLGDWIYAQAFYLSTQMEDQACSRELAGATMRVCEGEIHQNLTRGDFALSEADYISQVDGKTAELFRAGGLLAAHYAGATPQVQEACARYGLLAGRAFQIADDLLDLEGEETTTGKSLGTDWANGKMTMPLFFLRDSLDLTAQDELRKLFGAGHGREVLLGKFQDSLIDALAKTRLRVKELLDEACDALVLLPNQEVAQNLAVLTRFLGNRKH